MDYRLQQKALIENIVSNINQGSDIKSSVVEMRNDYEEDDEICLTSISFLPDELKAKVMSDVIEPLKHIQPNHYFYPKESLHLTIKNIRTIHKPPTFTDEDVEKVNKKFSEIIPTHKRFNFDLQGLVRFPTSVSIMGYCGEELYRLVKELDEGLEEINVPDDKKYVSDTVFFGNITICRFKEEPSRDFLEYINKMKELEIGSMPIDKISLINCNAGCSVKSLKIINTYSLA
jgi:2'-5' RNA ligase